MTSKSQADFLKTLPQTAANPGAIDAGVPSSGAPSHTSDGPASRGLVTVQDMTGPLARRTAGKSVPIALGDHIPDGLFINTR